MKQCITCNSTITSKYGKKFCSKSCSATYNNRGVRRHPDTMYNLCVVCDSKTKNAKYCSKLCESKNRQIRTEDDIKLSNRIRQSLYRAKGYRKIHPQACNKKVKEIYKNCPEGYEVDHIVPLSLGGWHHQDNLQYLTVEENRKKSNRYIG